MLRWYFFASLFLFAVGILLQHVESPFAQQTVILLTWLPSILAVLAVYHQRHVSGPVTISSPVDKHPDDVTPCNTVSYAATQTPPLDPTSPIP